MLFDYLLLTIFPNVFSQHLAVVHHPHVGDVVVLVCVLCVSFIHAMTIDLSRRSMSASMPVFTHLNMLYAAGSCFAKILPGDVVQEGKDPRVALPLRLRASRVDGAPEAFAEILLMYSNFTNIHY